MEVFMRTGWIRGGFHWLVPVAIAALAGGVTLLAQSGARAAWRTGPIVIDGLLADWPALGALDRGPDLGALNDEEFLYLAVSGKDPRLLPPLATGLILWIDPAGRRSRAFGVRVPGVLQPLLPGMTPEAAPKAGAYSTKVLDRLDVLGPGENQRRLVDLTPDMGIELAYGYTEGEIVYELKIPLEKTSARSIAVNPAGRPIGLGVATPESPRDIHARQRLVGSDGFIGGHPFYGGGFASFREPDGRVTPLEVWTTLILASNTP
jgi:hypothetical protein